MTVVFQTQGEEIEALKEKMLDLRLQVREEAIKNSHLDEVRVPKPGHYILIIVFNLLLNCCL